MKSTVCEHLLGASDPPGRCSIDVHCRRVAGGTSSRTRANSFPGTCISRCSRGPSWNGFVYPDSLISWFSVSLPEGLPDPLVYKGEVEGQGSQRLITGHPTLVWVFGAPQLDRSRRNVTLSPCRSLIVRDSVDGTGFLLPCVYSVTGVVGLESLIEVESESCQTLFSSGYCEGSGAMLTPQESPVVLVMDSCPCLVGDPSS